MTDRPTVSFRRILAMMVKEFVQMRRDRLTHAYRVDAHTH